MIDQSHNLKGKMEAMVQTVCSAQELYARAALVPHDRLAEMQDACKLVEAEELFRGCFYTDVRPVVQAWRTSKGLPADPLAALRTSGYVERLNGNEPPAMRTRAVPTPEWVPSGRRNAPRRPSRSAVASRFHTGCAALRTAGLRPEKRAVAVGCRRSGSPRGRWISRRKRPCATA